jgi:hypothetical protein
MPPFRILTVVENAIFTQGLGTLLAKHPNLVVSSRGKLGLKELIRAISEFQADIVVIGETTCLGAPDALFQLLLAFPGLRIFVFSMENNSLQVFSKEEFLLSQATDLVNLIQAV